MRILGKHHFRLMTNGYVFQQTHHGKLGYSWRYVGYMLGGRFLAYRMPLDCTDTRPT